MSADSLNLKIVIILTMGFAIASILGYLSNRIKLSPILGYLVAGYIIGPYSPGFVADLETAEQLAEIGVILMMFGVGLHFKWHDLMKVKNIAVPGAIVQTLVASILGMVTMYCMGFTIQAGIVFGLAIGVASTMVVVRQLTENRILHTPQGHIAVGWLIVEDLITVAALLMIPTLAASINGEFSFHHFGVSLLYIVLKFILLAAILVFVWRHRFVTYVLKKIMGTHSEELFTLTILAITFVIATGSALFFGTSIALGAFIAGMVIGHTAMRHQVSLNTTPLKDAFVVVFFLSVGMLFNPNAIIENYLVFLAVLSIILIAKPLAAFFIAYMLKHPFKTAMTVAIALAQIGEFSFILAEEALRYQILPFEAYDIIVACALVSISINPLLFKLFKIDKLCNSA